MSSNVYVDAFNQEEQRRGQLHVLILVLSFFDGLVILPADVSDVDGQIWKLDTQVCVSLHEQNLGSRSCPRR